MHTHPRCSRSRLRLQRISLDGEEPPGKRGWEALLHFRPHYLQGSLLEKGLKLLILPGLGSATCESSVCKWRLPCDTTVALIEEVGLNRA